VDVLFPDIKKKITTKKKKKEKKSSERGVINAEEDSPPFPKRLPYSSEATLLKEKGAPESPKRGTASITEKERRLAQREKNGQARSGPRRKRLGGNVSFSSPKITLKRDADS